MNGFKNAVWFIFGGVWQGLTWTIYGFLWSLTVIGIPIGKQCFKLASFAFFPFGKEVRFGGGAVSFPANIIWMIVSGLPLALNSLMCGLLLCCTVIGIPFGRQCFRFARLALAPFGAEVTR